MLKKDYKTQLRKSENELVKSDNSAKTGSTDVEFNMPEIFKNVREFVQKLIPTVILLQEFNGNFIFQIPIEGFNAEYLFTEMEGNKKRLKISDWGISQCSLEDVFTRICTVKVEED